MADEQPRPSRFKERACALCGDVFRTPEPTRKYCSVLCRTTSLEARRRSKGQVPGTPHGGPVKTNIDAADTAPWEEG